jgi:glycosyltransferase involved in cell wall biosynthesis
MGYCYIESEQTESTVEPTDRGRSSTPIAVAVLTGGIDRPYAYGLTTGLATQGIRLEVIGSTELDCTDIRETSGITFLNLHGDSRIRCSAWRKALRYFAVYIKLLTYAATAKPKIFHVLWNYKLPFFDRTILMLYYKILGKKIVLTAHNVNAAERDGTESALNRISLTVQYALVDHIFVHTPKMKDELISVFRVSGEKVTVIRFGINNSLPVTGLTANDAKRKLGITASEKTLLFFGRIRAYKGLDYLVQAFKQVAQQEADYKLIIAGEMKKDSSQYWHEVQESIARTGVDRQIIQHIRFIEDAETEVYFKAADVLMLPYTAIFQSGVLFLAYSFGLPVIATDTGSLCEDIVEGETGYTCRPCDENDLAKAIKTYFTSDLYRMLGQRRPLIKEFAKQRNSWDSISETTRNVYCELLTGPTG